MASKRGRVSKGSSSRTSLTPNAPTFPNVKFLSEAHPEKYFKLVDYHIVRETTFDLNDLQGFGEVKEVLQQRQWVSFNNLIHETNKRISLEFYANATFGKAKGGVGDISWFNTTSQNLRILPNFEGVGLFFVQTLEAASNQSQFIMKRCLGLLALLRGEVINLGLLIAENIKYMANNAQKACGNFYVINELCRRVSMTVYPDGELISPKAPLNASAIRRLQNMHHGEAAQSNQ
ncbi:hypothetical protein KIW84_051542 [Lathyrus oleraceus]|uniref:Uncharacterized protein n=1 Tax=Pisum sativum TaxID=3888 RepID=A0A9D4WKD3_PEA|nr:hypothetical protein KIW84_051542 [Pisum sativum]